MRYIAIYILSCRVHSIYCDIFCPAERLRYMTCRLLTSNISTKEFHHYCLPPDCKMATTAWCACMYQHQCLEWCNCTSAPYHCTSVPVHHVPPQALAPILCNALMRSSLHGWRVHGHNVVTYHCHGGLDNCQPESTFMFHWVYSRPWLLLCFLQFGLLLVLCNASLCNGSNQCLHFS